MNWLIPLLRYNVCPQFRSEKLPKVANISGGNDTVLPRHIKRQRLDGQQHVTV